MPTPSIRQKLQSRKPFQHVGIKSVHRDSDSRRRIEAFGDNDCLIWQREALYETEDSVSSARHIYAADAPPPLWHTGTFSTLRTTLVYESSPIICNPVTFSMPCSLAKHAEITDASAGHHLLVPYSS